MQLPIPLMGLCEGWFPRTEPQTPVYAPEPILETVIPVPHTDIALAVVDGAEAHTGASAAALLHLLDESVPEPVQSVPPPFFVAATKRNQSKGRRNGRK
jgi:hypothetical protein